ncbi:hypothetical protein JHK82_019313 [Glycine max]|uniref:Uncharacterized protein n=2 Tax=Glycine subgen. Soja TaxID=1462606 RepID=K7L2U2_SOYBN|nr:hypothetical protein JHK82_019313 [Glycine max]KAH1087738.1 hypothetical protein GYH30_019024 [Glycine max]KHN30984.1 hypothetical protein glysoja_020282 [Glycine soja]KRH50136.1 hypothetical protein GLYMA_07G202800v4 [Glycine max]RZC03822.1 hypothetical protein D0Y65_018460 [Glycine soja]
MTDWGICASCVDVLTTLSEIVIKRKGMMMMMTLSGYNMEHGWGIPNQSKYYCGQKTRSGLWEGTTKTCARECARESINSAKSRKDQAVKNRRGRNRRNIIRFGLGCGSILGRMQYGQKCTSQGERNTPTDSTEINPLKNLKNTSEQSEVQNLASQKQKVDECPTEQIISTPTKEFWQPDHPNSPENSRMG